ncbi:MAG TPA: efflux RND transporter periplasmic adaptor subunit [Verrucomicrobiae bacterium]
MKPYHYLPALLVAAILASACSRRAPRTAAPVPVLTAKSMATNLPVLILPAPVGHVTPLATVTVRPQVGGMISQVGFQEGQDVKTGQLLFRIDARPMQAALDQAKANLQRDTAQMNNSRIQFEREQKLFDQKLVSQDEYDTSKAALDALIGTISADRAAVTNAELNLAYTEIRSPINGRAGALQFHEGNVVKAPDDVLLVINQVHPIYVEFAVPERYLPEIRRQMRDHPLAVTASFENMEGEPPRGELTFVDNAVDSSTGTIQLRGTFPNEQGRLWPGQFVHVALQLKELTNAVVVPSQAVQIGQDGEYAFVVKSDKTVENRTVKTGVTYRGLTVIDLGINAGETVVTDGQLRLLPGVVVNDKEGK